LCKEAVELLKKLHDDKSDSDYVFPNDKGGHLTDVKKTWQTVCKNAKLNNARLHDIWASHEGVSEMAFLFKLAVIIPLGILVSIATKTLRKLEQAKEYYEHKASVSQAVEGYRKLYDGTDTSDRTELIKKTVAEVLKNPADSLSQTAQEDSDLLQSFDKLTDICKKFTGK